MSIHLNKTRGHWKRLCRRFKKKRRRNGTDKYNAKEEDSVARENEVETVTITGVWMEVDIGGISSHTRSQAKRGLDHRSVQLAQNLQAPPMIHGGGTVRYEPLVKQLPPLSAGGQAWIRTLENPNGTRPVGTWRHQSHHLLDGWASKGSTGREPGWIRRRQ